MFYFDFRFVGGNEAHVYNVEHFAFTHDRRIFKLYLSNGCNDLFDLNEIEYIGIGNMEDLDLGIHLPYTLYM